ncbi:MAG: AraC family transcriptional regulator [Pyrinomonadaceae bacterium]
MAREKRDEIRVWWDAAIDGIEYRMGVAVAEPYPKHWHEEYQLCLVTEGGGELVYRGRHDTPAASLFIVHPGEVHSNSTDTGCSFRSAYIDPGVFEELLSESPTSQRSMPFFRDCMIFDTGLIKGFLALHCASEAGATPLEKGSLLQDFLIDLMMRRANTGRALKEAGREPVVVDMIQNYIIDNLERNISLAELERLTGFSSFHINRVFSKAVGVPPHAFQTQVRVAEAKRLIRLGHTIAETAAAVGFADQSHFHRHFRRLMKVTPGEYFRASKNVQY